MEIYIIRHGETVWNTERRLQGRTDIELNEKGIQLAEVTAEQLKTIPFDKIYCSPLKRAYHTARILASDRDIPVIKNDLIKEMSFGEWEGVKDKELIESGSKFRYFFKEPALYEPAPSGESFEQICRRAAEFMTSVIEPEASSCNRIMIVAHGAINKAMMMHVRKSDVANFWAGGLQKNCGTIILDYTDGVYTILEENRIYY